MNAKIRSPKVVVIGNNRLFMTLNYPRKLNCQIKCGIYFYYSNSLLFLSQISKNMVKLREGICNSCTDNKPKKLIKGLCQYHYWSAKRQESQKNKPPKKKEWAKKSAARKKEKLPDLQKWFEERHEEMVGICCNCGAITDKYNHRWKWGIAHILPKKSSFGGFPSVATNRDNWIELCMVNGCHQTFDGSWDAASKMKCFPLAKFKFMLFKNDIAQEERYRIPEVFLK